MAERTRRDTWSKLAKTIHAQLMASRAQEECAAIHPCMGLRFPSLMEKRRLRVDREPMVDLP